MVRILAGADVFKDVLDGILDILDQQWNPVTSKEDVCLSLFMETDSLSAANRLHESVQEERKRTYRCEENEKNQKWEICNGFHHLSTRMQIKWR